jgi:hypothetical protein
MLPATNGLTLSHSEQHASRPVGEIGTIACRKSPSFPGFILSNCRAQRPSQFPLPAAKHPQLTSDATRRTPECALRIESRVILLQQQSSRQGRAGSSPFTF